MRGKNKKLISFVLTTFLVVSLIGTVSVFADTGEEEFITVEYVVKTGDTLYFISNLFGVEIDDIMRQNNIPDNTLISTGQKIVMEVLVDNLPAEETVNRFGKEITYETNSEMISLDFIDTDVKDILSILSIKMGVYMIYAGESARVDFKIENVSPWAAFEYFLKTIQVGGSALTYITEGNMVIVGTDKKVETDFLNNMIITRFRLNYITPDNLKKQLSSLGVEINIVILEETDNYIFVQGNAYDLSKIQQVIYALDRAEYFPKPEEEQLEPVEQNIFLTQYTLKYITAEELRSLISQMGISVQTVIMDSNEQTIWIHGNEEAMLDVKELINKIDNLSNENFDNRIYKYNLEFLTYTEILEIKSTLQIEAEIFLLGNDAHDIYINCTPKQKTEFDNIIEILDVYTNIDKRSFFFYTLEKITSTSAIEKLGSLDIKDMKIHELYYSEIGVDLLIICPYYKEEEIKDYLILIDVDGSIIKRPVDSSEFSGNLSMRKVLISELTGIPEAHFSISNNVSKTDTPYYVTWVEDTPENIKKIIDMIIAIDTP